MFGGITLKPVRAELAIDKDWLGKMDPYVKVRTMAGEFRTQVAYNQGKTPFWNDAFTINAMGDIHLSVWDKDTFSADDCLAETTINPVALLQTGRAASWHPLYKKGRPQGQIYVEIYPQGGMGPMGGFPPQGPMGGFPPQGPMGGFPPQGPMGGMGGYPPQGGYGGMPMGGGYGGGMY